MYQLYNKRVLLDEKKNEKRIPLPRFNTCDKIAFEIVLKYIHTGKISATILIDNNCNETILIDNCEKVIYNNFGNGWC